MGVEIAVDVGVPMVLPGKVAVITGASTGIGRAVAVLMAQRGVRLVLAARRTERLQRVIDEIEAQGGEAIAVPTDVRDSASVEHLADTAFRVFGQVDIAIFNAGVPALDNLLDCDLLAWQSTIDTNIYGLLNGLKAFVSRMQSQGKHGAIYATGSGAGSNGTNYHTAPYSVSKSAQLSIIECLYAQLRDAQSLLRTGIILPPITRTNLVGDDLSVWDMVAQSMKGVAIIEPEDFAHIIVKGIEAGDFWIEATPETDQQFLAGKNSVAIDHSRRMIQAKAQAMVEHTAPDPYLW